MKMIFTVVIACLASSVNAATFGCFAGVIGAPYSTAVEVSYNHYQLFYHKKTTTEILPFLGCGIIFNF